MPRFNSDAPEYQGLLDIKNTVIPHTAWHSYKTNSLAIINARANLNFQVRMMLLYLSPDQDHPRKHYDDIIRGIRLVRDKLQLVESQGRSHQSQMRTEQERLSTGALIKTSPSRQRSTSITSINTAAIIEDAAQTVAAFNNENRLRCDPTPEQEIYQLDFTHKDPQATSNDFESPEYLASLSKSQRVFSNFFGALAGEFRKGDHKGEHRLKLQIRGMATDRGEGGDVLPEMFLSVCLSQKEWLGTERTFTSSRIESSSPTSVCKAVQAAFAEKTSVHLVVYADGTISDFKASLSISTPSHLPSAPLRDVIPFLGEEFFPYDKVLIARNIAQTLLRMYSAEMQDREWTSSNIFFLQDEDSKKNEDPKKVYQAYNPYIEICFPPSKISTVTGIPEHKFPILLSLAKLLVEIALQKTLGKFHTRLDIDLLELVEKEVEKTVTSNYVYAIKRCIEATRSDDKARSGTEGKDQCQSTLHSVVSLLEKARRDFHPRANKDLNLPMDFVLSAPLQSVQWAKTYFERAEAFYKEHISNLTTAEPIKIAILDTGVNRNHQFFKTKRRARNRRRDIFPGIRCFVEESINDSPEHGTDVAALILKIAPESDLYIAKICKNREMVGVAHIIEAIKWARECGVQIINMSFGLDLCDEEMRENVQEEIELAEAAGIIIFAAASNEGANRSRSYPASTDKAIGIHMTDGMGKPDSRNPPFYKDSENLGTLGVSIESPCTKKILAGNSYSTPIVAGIAANILRLVKESEERAKKDPVSVGIKFKSVCKREVMRRILLGMSNKVGGVDYITPWSWAIATPPCDFDGHISKIRGALLGGR